MVWLSSLPRRRRATFEFEGETYRYFRHPYNVTWLNERRVEIPIVRAILDGGGEALLEVGNVLSHYDESLRHPVVDRYERTRRQNIYTEDAEMFVRGAPYDMILSISTLEHVGQDETPRDRAKVGRTIRHLRGLLSPRGSLVFTAPVGYNQSLDRVIDDADGFIRRGCLRRLNSQNEWEEAEWDDVREARFHHPYPFANAIVVAQVQPA